MSEKSGGRGLGALALAATLALGLIPFIGASLISPGEIFGAPGPDALIFWRLRLPRTLAAFLAGGGLALGGLLYQGLFRNALATPYTLGISSGAAFGAALYFCLAAGRGWAGAGALWPALAGGLACLAPPIALQRRGLAPAALLLAGIMLNFFFSSLAMLVQYFSDPAELMNMSRWLMGSLAGVGAASLPWLAILVFGCWFWASRRWVELDLLLAGEELAASRGVDVEKVKLRIFIAASIVVGVIVSITGPIGFVGMMIPQICRLMLGFGHALLVPASFFLGGGFLVACDVLARSVMAPAELPIGILTAMTGAPFFLWTLFRGNSAGELY